MSRGVEGFITVDTSLTEAPTLPTVAVAGHRKVRGVTNIILDHRRAAELALKHLRGLGHEKIAFLKGHPSSSDAAVRWESICIVAQEMGLRVDPELTVQIDSEDSTPALGYPFGKRLLSRKRPFTALFAYNDLSAMGAISAFREAGLRVPEDVSVIGFDDISSAALAIPPLTTVRQPLVKMGNIAARTVVEQIEKGTKALAEIAVDPELVVRLSTARIISRELLQAGRAK